MAVGLLGALVLVGAACGKSSGSSTSPTRPPITPTPVTGPTQSSPTPSPSTEGPTSSNAATIQQGAGGFVFSPSMLTLRKGEGLTVSNVGSATHTFTITGKGVDVVNTPGQSQNVTITLAPGTYQFICRFHVSFGMKGTLTVTG